MKEFFELLAKDKAVQEELMKASLEALKAFIESKGLTDEALKVLGDARANVAKAHGFKGEMEAVSPEEMKAVAGGDWGCLNIMAAFPLCAGRILT